MSQMYREDITEIIIRVQKLRRIYVDVCAWVFFMALYSNGIVANLTDTQQYFPE